MKKIILALPLTAVFFMFTGVTAQMSFKVIVPFCTHEGSGLGNSVGDIVKLCPKSKLLNGLAIREEAL